MRAKVSTSLLSIVLLFACSSGAEDLADQEEVDRVSDSTSISPTTALDASTSTTVIPDSSKTSETSENVDEAEYGAGGLVGDLESWADRDLPLFITASHIDVSDIERISMFRSNAGHDYSDSFESCCSMKHYYRPFDYYEKRFTQPIFSPVDGVILYIGVDENSGEASWLRE